MLKTDTYLYLLSKQPILSRAVEERHSVDVALWALDTSDDAWLKLHRRMVDALSSMCAIKTGPPVWAVMLLDEPLRLVISTNSDYNHASIKAGLCRHLAAIWGLMVTWSSFGDSPAESARQAVRYELAVRALDWSWNRWHDRLRKPYQPSADPNSKVKRDEFLVQCLKELIANGSPFSPAELEFLNVLGTLWSSLVSDASKRPKGMGYAKNVLRHDGTEFRVHLLKVNSGLVAILRSIRSLSASWAGSTAFLDRCERQANVDIEPEYHFPLRKYILKVLDYCLLQDALLDAAADPAFADLVSQPDIQHQSSLASSDVPSAEIDVMLVEGRPVLSTDFTSDLDDPDFVAHITGQASTVATSSVSADARSLDAQTILQLRQRFTPEESRFTVKDKCTMHCECILLYHLIENDIPPDHLVGSYVGISKLSCAACADFFTVFGTVFPDYRVSARGCHGGVSVPWRCPGFGPHYDPVIQQLLLTQFQRRLQQSTKSSATRRASSSTAASLGDSNLVGMFASFPSDIDFDKAAAMIPARIEAARW